MAEMWRHLGVDHVTVCVPHSIERVVDEYVRHQHGRIVFRNVDVTPASPSSMMLYGIACDDTYLMAIAQGIDRAERSHVSLFCDQHGAHAIQHIALRVSNLEAYVAEMQSQGKKFLGDIHTRKDPFGDVRQIFATPFDGFLSVSQAPFYEFVERPVGWQLSGDLVEVFSDKFAAELADDIERARKNELHESFFGDMFCIEEAGKHSIDRR